MADLILGYTKKSNSISDFRDKLVVAECNSEIQQHMQLRK